MGITIHYQGAVDSNDKVYEIINDAENFSESLNWTSEKYQEEGNLGIIISPHERCESVSLVFDNKLKLKSYTKTGFAPEEIHYEIIKLLYSLKNISKNSLLLMNQDIGMNMLKA